LIAGQPIADSVSKTGLTGFIFFCLTLPITKFIKARLNKTGFNVFSFDYDNQKTAASVKSCRFFTLSK